MGIYDVQEKKHAGKSWYTATVKDPITNELFKSGMVEKEVNVKKHASASLKLPLHLAKTRIIDGKIIVNLNNCRTHTHTTHMIRADPKTVYKTNKRGFYVPAFGCPGSPAEGTCTISKTLRSEFEALATD